MVLLEYFTNMTQTCIILKNKPGGVVNTCNPSTKETEVGGPRI